MASWLWEIACPFLRAQSRYRRSRTQQLRLFFLQLLKCPKYEECSGFLESWTNYAPPHFGPFDPRGTFLVSSQCQACISHAFGWPFKLNSYCCSCLLSYCKMLFWKPWIKLLCVVVFQPWIFSLEGSFNQGLNLQLGFYYGSFSSNSTSPGKGSVPSSSIWKMIAILIGW